MTRLNMIVEGQTEEAFVHAVIEEPLAAIGVYVAVRCVETSRSKKRGRIYRGGLLSYQKARGDLIRWMKEDQDVGAHFTTMFDLYALPTDFPPPAPTTNLSDPYQRIAGLEIAFAQDVGHPRFIPYLQLHEFEALLLADPSKFDWEFIDQHAAITRLIALGAAAASPELIDDGEATAPSKRIIKEIPEYEGRKSSAGPLIASKIGFAVLRQKCPHFDAWIIRLESLAP